MRYWRVRHACTVQTGTSVVEVDIVHGEVAGSDDLLRLAADRTALAPFLVEDLTSPIADQATFDVPDRHEPVRLIGIPRQCRLPRPQLHPPIPQLGPRREPADQRSILALARVHACERLVDRHARAVLFIRPCDPQAHQNHYGQHADADNRKDHATLELLTRSGSRSGTRSGTRSSTRSGCPRIRQSVCRSTCRCTRHGTSGQTSTFGHFVGSFTCLLVIQNERLRRPVDDLRLHRVEERISAR